MSRCQSSLPRYRKSSPGGLPRRCRAPRASSTRRSTERRGTKGLLSSSLCRPVGSLSLLPLSLSLPLRVPAIARLFPRKRNPRSISARCSLAPSARRLITEACRLPSLLSSLASPARSPISLDTEPLARRRCCLLATPSPFPRSSRRAFLPPPPPLSLLLADCVPCRRPLTFLPSRAVHPVAALNVVVYFASSLIPFLRVLYPRRPTAPLNLIDLEVTLESSWSFFFNAPELVAAAALIVTPHLSPYLNRSSTIKALARWCLQRRLKFSDSPAI